MVLLVDSVVSVSSEGSGKGLVVWGVVSDTSSTSKGDIIDLTANLLDLRSARDLGRVRFSNSAGDVSLLTGSDSGGFSSPREGVLLTVDDVAFGSPRSLEDVDLLTDGVDISRSPLDCLFGSDPPRSLAEGDLCIVLLGEKNERKSRELLFVAGGFGGVRSLPDVDLCRALCAETAESNSRECFPPVVSA